MKKTLSVLIFLFLLSFINTSNAQEGFIGEIRMFAGNFAPRNWAFCDGQLLPISQNQALFSILGTTYGGDGRTTFALPDLRGRVAIHPGAGTGLSTYVQGQKGGTETNTISVSQMPSHSHQVNAVAEDGTESTPTSNLPAGTKVLDKEYSQDTPNTTMNSEMIEPEGDGQPINNIQPYGTVNYIICLQGIFPSRS
ncbi:tail fiber protein [Flavobacteriaceae bacterium GSB9]|nr:tail fiber protein [Flavobacteriaceae bacterium GSB9]